MNTRPLSYSDYRPAGQGWLKCVPAHWETPRLKTWVSINAKVLPETTDPDYGFNYVEIGSVSNGSLTEEPKQVAFRDAPSRARRVVRQGDTIVSTVRTYLKAVWFAETATNLICSTGFAVLSPKPNTVPKFAAYLALSDPFIQAVVSNSVGIGYPAIPETKFGDIAVPVPPPEEQAAIVRYLDHADELINRYISAKERLIALLEEQRQAAIHLALTRGLDPLVKFRPSGQHWLGNIPEHWEICRAKRLFSPRRESARQDDIQLSATQAYGVIPQDEYERRQGRRIVKISLHLDKRQHVEVDDFVISMRSFQGGLERAWSSGCIRSSYVILRPRPEVDVEWFSYLFKSHAYIQALQSTANFIRDGQDLNFNNFCAVDLPLPPLAEQRKAAIALGKATSNIDTNIVRARRQINLMIEYRTRLIADAVTGQLDMSEAAVKLPD